MLIKLLTHTDLYQAFRPSTYYAGVVWLAVLFLQGLAYSLTGVGPGATVVACITYGLFGIFLLVGRPFKLLIINLIGGIVMLFAVIVRIFIQANVSSEILKKNFFFAHDLFFLSLLLRSTARSSWTLL